MRAGAAHLIGRHDFTTFRSSICQAKSPVRTMDAIEIEELPYPAGREFRFRLRARSFLHNQVRGIVGTLERVGAGAWPPERVAAALAARDRAACGPVCPPDGLYLTAVRYPVDPFEDPAGARRPAAEPGGRVGGRRRPTGADTTPAARRAPAQCSDAADTRVLTPSPRSASAAPTYSTYPQAMEWAAQARAVSLGEAIGKSPASDFHWPSPRLRSLLVPRRLGVCRAPHTTRRFGRRATVEPSAEP